MTRLSNTVLLFSSLHQLKNRISEDILDLPLNVTFCRLCTMLIYNFGAARDAEVPHNISFEEPPAPNMAITHRENVHKYLFI